MNQRTRKNTITSNYSKKLKNSMIKIRIENNITDEIKQRYYEPVTNESRVYYYFTVTEYFYFSHWFMVQVKIPAEKKLIVYIGQNRTKKNKNKLMQK